jgi:hypothetical protein
MNAPLGSKDPAMTGFLFLDIGSPIVDKRLGRLREWLLAKDSPHREERVIFDLLLN